jgi:O-antigen/teichoic acid export membrane protein
MWVARLVGPNVFGVWNALQPILMYGSLLFLGVPNAMNRDVPFLRGSSNDQMAAKVINFTFWVILMASGFGTIVLAISSGLPFTPKNFQKPLLFMAILFVSTSFYMFFNFLLKSNIQFRLMSHQQLVLSVIWPIGCLVPAYFLQIEGYIAGQALVFLAICFLIFKMSPITIMTTIDWSLLVPMIKRGFPIMAAGVVYSLMATVDRWIILAFLGIESLGQYAIAILTMGLLTMLPQIVAQQFYPRMALEFGKSGSSRQLIHMVVNQSGLAFVVTLPIVLITYILLPVLVPVFLPLYVRGIDPARILLFGIAFIPLTGGVANFLNTVGKQLYYLVNQMAALIVNILMGVHFVHLGWGLEGIALASSIAWIFYTLSLNLTGLIYIKRMRSLDLVAGSIAQNPIAE